MSGSSSFLAAIVGLPPRPFYCTGGAAGVSHSATRWSPAPRVDKSLLP
jgi:hypothetical protein